MLPLDHDQDHHVVEDVGACDLERGLAVGERTLPAGELAAAVGVLNRRTAIRSEEGEASSVVNEL